MTSLRIPNDRRTDMNPDRQTGHLKQRPRGQPIGRLLTISCYVLPATAINADRVNERLTRSGFAHRFFHPSDNEHRRNDPDDAADGEKEKMNPPGGLSQPVGGHGCGNERIEDNKRHDQDGSNQFSQSHWHGGLPGSCKYRFRVDDQAFSVVNPVARCVLRSFSVCSNGGQSTWEKAH